MLGGGGGGWSEEERRAESARLPRFWLGLEPEVDAVRGSGLVVGSGHCCKHISPGNPIFLSPQEPLHFLVPLLNLESDGHRFLSLRTVTDHLC